MSRIEGAGKTDIHLMDPLRLEIISDPKNVLYDPRLELPVSERLVQSIMKIGVKIPVLARRDGDRLIVVDGRQRVRAAVEANARLQKEDREPVRIGVKMERASDADLYDTMIAANEHRQADPPLTVARKMQRALDMGRTEEEVAVTFNRPLASVKQHLALLDCSPVIQKALEWGLPVTAAAKLAKLPREQQAEALKEAKGNGVREVTKAVRKKQGRVDKDEGMPPSRKELKRLMHYLEFNAEVEERLSSLEMLRWVLTGKESKALEIMLIDLKVADRAKVKKDEAA